MAAWWGGQLANNMELMTLDQAVAAIDDVTPADIQRLAQTLWQPEALTLAYVGPLKSEQRLVDWFVGVGG